MQQTKRDTMTHVIYGITNTRYIWYNKQQGLDFYHDKIPPWMAVSKRQKHLWYQSTTPLHSTPFPATMQAIRSLDFHHDEIPPWMAASEWPKHLSLHDHIPLPFPAILSLDFHHKILIRVAVAEWPNFSSRTPPPPHPTDLPQIPPRSTAYGALWQH